VGIKVADALNLGLGLIQVPFGRETSSYFFGSRTIERSVTMEALAPLRDAGVQIHGKAAKTLYYSVAVVTGSYGLAINRRDKLDFVGRATFGLKSLAAGIPWLEGFEIGVSGQYGEQPFNPIMGASTYVNFRAQRDIIFRAPFKGVRYRVGADLAYEYGPFGMQAEGAYERSQRSGIVTPAAELAEGGTEDASDIERFGGYVEAGMFVLGDRSKGLEALVRAELFWAKSTGPDVGEAILNPLKMRLFTAGFNYYFRSTARLRLNGVLIDMDREPLPQRQEPPLFTFRDNRLSWSILTELQFWFL
jgi:hypothetical protein